MARAAIKHETPVLNMTDRAFLLEYPFRPDQIQRRPDGLDYIEGAAVIQRLNDCLGYDGWSFEILEQSETEDEAIVRGQLTIYTAGRIIVKEQYGGHPYNKRKNTDEILSRSDTFKAAATDCLKKCASLLGIGLHLYGSDGIRSFRYVFQQSQEPGLVKAFNVPGNGKTEAGDNGKASE